MIRALIVATAAAVAAFLTGFVVGAWCDAIDLIEWED